MAGQPDARASGGRRPCDDVHARTVVPDEVHVDGGETPHRSADVPREVERLHEYLGHDHCRAEVQVDAAVEPTDHAGEEAKVAQAALADRRTVGGWVHVDDVRAY